MFLKSMFLKIKKTRSAISHLPSHVQCQMNYYLWRKHLAELIYHSRIDFLVFEYLGDYNTPIVLR